MRSRWSESWSHFEGLINPDDVVIQHVRQQSAAGWFIGAVEFYDFEEMDIYSRDTGYYPTEEMLKEEYPRSISLQEAFNKMQHDPLHRRKMERKLGKK